MNRIGIIGAGITGLSFANHAKGVSITFFDKSRKAGGRISTRSTRQSPDLNFDHGFQYLEKIEENSNLITRLTQLNCIRSLKINLISDFTNSNVGSQQNIVIGNSDSQSISDSLLEASKASINFNTRIKKIERTQFSEYFLTCES